MNIDISRGNVSYERRLLREAALAHIVGDETERAYRRGDALQKRVKLMAAWSNFIDSAVGASVVNFRAA